MKNRLCIFVATVIGLWIAGFGAVAVAQHQHAHDEAVGQGEYPPELLRQLEEVRAATERFRDHQVAVDEGYESIGGDGPLMGEHWFRRDLTDKPFDISQPSTLQYLKVGDEYVLTGVAYTLYRSPDEPLPEGFAGDQDAWHVHDMVKISMTATEGRPLLRWITERRIANGKTNWSPDRAELTMVHAWVWMDNPDGVFAQDHRLIPYVRAGLPREWGVAASNEAAYGVSLLSDGACADEVRRVSWLGGASWGQRRSLTRACEAARGDVQEALDAQAERLPDTDARGFVTAAESAWNGYQARRDAILTAEQRARLAVGIEHPEGHGGGHKRP